MSGASCTVVVAQFGCAELTEACVTSLRAWERVLWPVVIVEDGGEEGRFEAAGVTRVRQEHAGVSAAWNRGAASASGRHLLFLNNDVLFRGAAIEWLVGALEAGAAVSGVRMRRERRLPRDILARLPCDRFVEGWCFAVSRKAFEWAGGFDTGMRLYFSDTDLQCRLVRESGRGGGALVVNGGLPLVHLGHRTARLLGERRRIWDADRDVFVRKWGGGREMTKGE